MKRFLKLLYSLTSLIITLSSCSSVEKKELNNDFNSTSNYFSISDAEQFNIVEVSKGRFNQNYIGEMIQIDDLLNNELILLNLNKLTIKKNKKINIEEFIMYQNSILESEMKKPKEYTNIGQNYFREIQVLIYDKNTPKWISIDEGINVKELNFSPGVTGGNFSFATKLTKITNHIIQDKIYLYNFQITFLKTGKYRFAYDFLLNNVRLYKYIDVIE